MAIRFFDGTITDPSIVLTSADGINNTDTVVLAETGTLVSTTSSGIALTFAVQEVVIRGDIFASGAGVNIAATGASDIVNYSVAVGATGSIFAENSGIYAGYQQATKPAGSEILVTNAGEIVSTDDPAALIFGTEQGRLDNTGIMTSQQTSGPYGSAAAMLDLTDAYVGNSGVMQSYQTAASGAGLQYIATVSFLNFFATIDNTIFDNSGVVRSEDYAYYSNATTSERVTNSGEIFGHMEMSDAAAVNSILTNTGLIAGDVQMNGGDDLYNGGGNGLVTGVVFGGGGEDTLRGSDQADQLDGGSGNDVLVGRGGDDTLLAGLQSDTVLGGDGNDSIDAGLAGDVVNGNTGDDTILGNFGEDDLRGGRDDDLILGGGNEDTIRGDSGDDIIIGGADRDNMFGGSGNDTFVFETVSDSGTGALRDRIYDFRSGEDLLDIGQLAGPQFQFLGTANFTGSGAREVRAVNLSNGTLIYIDQDGDGSRDSDIYLIGTFGVTEADFLL